MYPLPQMPLEEKYSGVRGQALAPLRHMLLDTPPGEEVAPLLQQLRKEPPLPASCQQQIPVVQPVLKL